MVRLFPAVVLAVLGTACAGPEDRTPTTDSRLIVPDTTALVADPAPDATVEDTTRDASEEGEVTPGGGATLTIGERRWRFPSVVCLEGENALQVEAEFAMSGVAEGYELYVEIADTGHLITLDDIGGVAEEPVSLTTSDTTAFLSVTETGVNGRATFVPVDDPTAEGVAGTLAATCP